MQVVLPVLKIMLIESNNVFLVFTKIKFANSSNVPKTADLVFESKRRGEASRTMLDVDKTLS